MYYSLIDTPLVTDTAAGIRITTFTADFMGCDNPDTTFVSMVLLPCPALDALEVCEYQTESDARLGHAELVNAYTGWSQRKVQSEIRNQFFGC